MLSNHIHMWKELGTMELGLDGLGRMGASIARRLLRDGHRVVVHDVNQVAVANLEDDGAIGTHDLNDSAENYFYELDIPAITEVWRRGGVIGSWLLDLTAAELASTQIWTDTRSACLTRVKVGGRC